jgi:hypothetical protein
MIKVPKLLTSFLCFALSACTTVDKYSFIRYGQSPDQTTNQFDPTAIPPLSDVLALNYASSVASILRCKFNGARIAREISSTAQVGLAAFAGAGAAFNWSASTITALGLGSAGIPELQKIFDAKGRAQVYQDAVRLIEEAEIEYLALNQRPLPNVLTQNGVTLFQRVTASIHVVEKTLAGNLPSVQDMQKATEPMSKEGALPTTAGEPAFNNLPANSSRSPRQSGAGMNSAQSPRTRFEGVIKHTTVNIPESPPPDASRVLKQNKLRGRIAKLTEPAAEAILAAGREHADLNSKFARTPRGALPARNYLFNLIETADDNELSVWGSIIPVRPAVAATPTEPSPHQ